MLIFHFNKWHHKDDLLLILLEIIGIISLKNFLVLVKVVAL